MNTPAILVEDVVMQFAQQQGWRSLLKREPGKIALDHVSLAVHAGEIFGLLGPNGAGKTTLIKVISTLTTPTSGKAYVAGQDVTRHSMSVRRNLGVVYGDERTFFWRLSALENLVFYASLYGMNGKEARRRAMELLELVGIAESAKVRMHHFSSGMRQRTSIARALLSDPEILIMDEPTRTLDPVGSEEIRRLIRERVANNRRCVLVATNIMAEAEFLCDRLAFINHGHIQMSGRIDEFRELLETNEVYDIVVSEAGWDDLERLESVHGVTSVDLSLIEDGRTNARLTLARDSEAIPMVIQRIVDRGGSVWSCTLHQLSLEEIFTRLARRERSPRKVAV